MAIVGEAPGAAEDRTGVPFVGKSGVLLHRYLDALEMPAAILNTVCCRPPGNRNPEREEVEACRPNFDAQLRHLDPWLVLLAGNTAMYNVLGKTGITKQRMRPHLLDGRLYLPIKHPAWYVRNRRHRPELLKDLKRVKMILDGHRLDESPPHTKQMSTMATAAVVKARVKARRSVKLYSNVLGTTIVVADDPKPGQYSIEELYALVCEADPDQLRAVSVLKKEMGAVKV